MVVDTLRGATIFPDEIFSQENPSRLFVSPGRPAQGATTSLGDGDTSTPPTVSGTCRVTRASGAGVHGHLRVALAVNVCTQTP